MTALNIIVGTVIASTLIIVIAMIITFSGDGKFTRMTTLGGIYAVCEVQGYPVVCFGDKSGNDGGLFCIPLPEVGGKCL